MNSVLQDLVAQLDLETLEVNLFRGQSRDLGGRSVFGGQVIGQALVAASRTVDIDHPPHSLHAYFLRPGDVTLPIVYEVDRTRDGKSFQTRRVQAIQQGAPILSMIASFQKPENGREHQATMPDVPPPEQLRPLIELSLEWIAAFKGEIPPRRRDWMTRAAGIEFRPVDPMNPLAPEPRPPHLAFWFRSSDTLPDNQFLHRCVLAYASDFTLLSTAQLPHGIAIGDPRLIVASIDHAIWFHRDVRVDDWLLYVTDSPSAQSARGYTRGQIFDRSGRLVASTAQEGLMRIAD